jgi:uncharacterized membrane protein (DUF106 family)
MKVTALMDDDLVAEVRKFSGGKNITESLVTALTDWVKMQRLKKLLNEQEKHPFQFADGYTAEKIRKLNRRRRDFT